MIVGAGFTGAVVAERIASQLGKSVLIIDRRPHIAGNAYDLRNDAGILYHAYGPHIFHTNADFVVDYLSCFTDWMPYEHRVLASWNGLKVPMAFNLTSLGMCLPTQAKRLERKLLETYGSDAAIAILKLREASDPELQDLAAFIYENFFVGYTLKQWGLRPDELSPAVTGRVPVRLNSDDRYFLDKFQIMPRLGYTKMFERILNHENINLGLGVDFNEASDFATFDNVLHCGAIDEYFSYEFGELPYRTMDFQFEVKQVRKHQAAAVINYPGPEPFTRITEMPYLTQDWGDHTCLVREYPMAHRPGETEPHYPIPRDDNQELYQRYRNLAAKEASNIIFAGRLGDYRYYNMDQAVARGLTIFTKQIAAQL